MALSIRFRQLLHRALLAIACIAAVLYLSGARPPLTTSWFTSREIELPGNLDDLVRSHWDTALAEERIFYDPGKARIIEDDGFMLEFRAVPMLKTKPITPPNDPGRVKAGGPFTSLHPKDVIARVGTSHNLILNKYCHFKPMLVLPTIRFEKQSNDLNLQDFNAVWSVMRAMSQKQVIIYNCGVNSGSSQGHKHLQLFPMSTNIDLFPSKASSSDAIASTIPHVPFKHYVLRLPPNVGPRVVYDQYLRLLVETKQALSEAHVSPDYNMIATADRIALVPRRTAYNGGPFGGNAAGMVGLVAVRDEDEIQRWLDLGPGAYLASLGIPLKQDSNRI